MMWICTHFGEWEMLFWLLVNLKCRNVRIGKLLNSLTLADIYHSRSKRENWSKLNSNHSIYPCNDRLSEIDCKSHIIKFCNDLFHYFPIIWMCVIICHHNIFNTLTPWKPNYPLSSSQSNENIEWWYLFLFQGNQRKYYHSISNN